MTDSDILYLKTLQQMEHCRDRAMEMMGRITSDVNDLGLAIAALHGDIAWLKREHHKRSTPADGQRESAAGEHEG